MAKKTIIVKAPNFGFKKSKTPGMVEVGVVIPDGTILIFDLPEAAEADLAKQGWIEIEQEDEEPENKTKPN